MTRIAPLHRCSYLLGAIALAAGFVASAPLARAQTADDSSPQNFIQVVNTQDHQLLVDGAAQLNVITGSTVTPLNEAVSYSSCNGCQSYAVALQIDLITKTASDVAPENDALAVNYQCTGCTTVADGYQYVISVNDPAAVKPGIVHQVAALDNQLQVLKEHNDGNPADVQASIDDIISRFKQIAASLNDGSNTQAFFKHDKKGV